MKQKIINVVAVKQHSKRAKNKNLILLPKTLFWLKKNNEIKNTVVISDSDLLLNIAKEFGVKTEKERPAKNQTELRSCRQVAKKYNADYIFNIPVTMPFRDYGLFQKFKRKIKKNNYDFIVSSRKIKNRDIFFIEKNNFKIKTTKTERRGASCNMENMVEGSLYLIKRSVLKNKRILGNDVYNYFWSLNFGVVKNCHPIYFDIDEEEDLENLLKILFF